jgi:hypothetical protein
VDQHAEPPFLKPPHRLAQQQHVLEHAAGQGHRAQPCPLAGHDAARLDQRGHAMVEAGRDDPSGDPSSKVGKNGLHQVAAPDAERAVAGLDAAPVGA